MESQAIIRTIELVNTVAGILLNCTLLYAIRRFSRTTLGMYKHLLTIFTLLDAFLVILHEIVHPKVMRAGYIHATATDTVFDDRRVTALYIGFQSVPFTLLGIHFLYRYWSVRRVHLIHLFSNKIFALSLFSLTFGALLSWYFLCLFSTNGHDISAARTTVVVEYERRFGTRIENAWILMDHWRDNKADPILLAMLAFMNVIMVGSVMFASSLAFLTFHHIRKSYKMSVQSNLLQRKLLVALCAQSAIPAVFVYTPYLICINIPFFGISGTIFHDMAVPVFTFFPVWDAAIVIILYPDYWRGLRGMLRKWEDQGVTAVGHTNNANMLSHSHQSVAYTNRIKDQA